MPECSPLCIKVWYALVFISYNILSFVFASLYINSSDNLNTDSYTVQAWILIIGSVLSVFIICAGFSIHDRTQYLLMGTLGIAMMIGIICAVGIVSCVHYAHDLLLVNNVDHSGVPYKYYTDSVACFALTIPGGLAATLGITYCVLYMYSYTMSYNIAQFHDEPLPVV